MTNCWRPGRGLPRGVNWAWWRAAARRRGWCLAGRVCGLALEVLGVEEIVEPDPGDTGRGNEEQAHIAVGKVRDVGPETDRHRPEGNFGIDNDQGDDQPEDDRCEPHDNAPEVHGHVFFSG